MESLYRLASRPQAKPFRTNNLGQDRPILLDDNGLLKFSDNDIEDPKQWSRARKWYITATSIILVMNASMSSSSPSGCLESISTDLGVSPEVAKLSITVYLLGFCSGPCLWAPLSEYYGRRVITGSTFLCYFACNFLVAFTPNIEGLLIGRFLCALFVSGVLSNTPGVFADLWGPIERGKCMTLFSCAMQVGPALGPITSGFYQLKLDWRWFAYQLLWVAGFSLLLLPTIPETLPSRALLAKAKRIRKAKSPGYEDIQAPIEVENRSLAAIFKVALLRPWQIAVDPISALVGLYITVVYSLLYMLFTIFPVVFIEKRGWNSGVGELPLLSVHVGAALAGLYVFWDMSRQRKRIAAGHKHTAEDTLPVAMTGAVIFPISMFWLAWTGEYNSVPWIAPTLAGVFLSMAICILFIAFLSYLSESYLMYAASAQAANTIVRSAVAAAAPLYTEQMFDKLGVAGGGSLIGGVALLLMPIPFVFYRYGARIRVKSRFAPTPVTHAGEVSKAAPEPVSVEGSILAGEKDFKHNQAVEEEEDRSSHAGSDHESSHDDADRYRKSSDVEKCGS